MQAGGVMTVAQFSWWVAEIVCVIFLASVGFAIVTLCALGMGFVLEAVIQYLDGFRPP